MDVNKIYQGDSLSVLKTFPDKCINMVMTSPPYWALRDYGVEGQLGLEPTFEQYINNLCNIFDEIKRVLRDDGTCWVNLGDTYAGGGSGQKDTGKHGYSPEVMNANKNTKWNNKVIIGDIKLRKRYCCECGKEFKSKSHQYFCSSKCSGVDNTPREIKGILENKNLVLIPFRFAIEMQNRGWILRNVIIWHKPNCMPSSIKDRFTVDFEYIFFFSKKKKYYFETQYENYKVFESFKRMKKGFNENQDGDVFKRSKYINKESEKNHRQGFHKNRDPSQYYSKKGRNKRCVWTINPQPFREAHFAVYPEKLCETPIKAGCIKEGIILDPFFGSGTTGLVALKNNRKFVGIESNQEYIEIANKRLKPYLEQKTLL